MPITNSQAVVMADGSAASPGMFFGTDATTGFYKVSGGIGVSAAGTSILTATSDGALASFADGTISNPSIKIGGANPSVGLYSRGTTAWGSGVLGFVDLVTDTQMGLLEYRESAFGTSVLMQMGTGYSIPNQASDYYAFTLAVIPQTITQGASNGGYVGLDLSGPTLTLVGAGAYNGEYVAIEYDKIDLESASAVTVAKAGQGRIGGAVAHTNVTITQNYGLRFNTPAQQGGVCTNYASIWIDNATPATTNVGILFGSEPNGGSIGSASSVDITIKSGNKINLNAASGQNVTATGANIVLTTASTGTISLGKLNYNFTSGDVNGFSIYSAATGNAVVLQGGGNSGADSNTGLTVRSSTNGALSLVAQGTGNVNVTAGGTMNFNISGTKLNYGASVGGAWTFSAPCLTLASATGSSGFRVPHGTAPTSPTNGDMWTTTAGLFVQINGVTKTATLT